MGLSRYPKGHGQGSLPATFSGKGIQSIWAIDTTGTPTSTLVNTTGHYEGSTAYGINGFENTTDLTIQTDGEWTLTISSIRDAPDITLPASGNGDGVFWYEDSSRKFDVEFPGDSYFALTTYPEYIWPRKGVHFIPEIALLNIVPGSRVERTVNLISGDALTIITATGSWNIKASS